jgi:hypothetical protein
MMEAVTVCMQDAMDQLIPYSGDDSREVCTISSDDALLEKFKQLVCEGTFVRLNAKRKAGAFAARLKEADGIIRSTSNGKRRYLLFSKALELWFPEKEVRQRLVKRLQSLGIFGEGRRQDTNTQQTYIAEFGKRIPCYKLRRARLLAFAADLRE